MASEAMRKFFYYFFIFFFSIFLFFFYFVAKKKTKNSTLEKIKTAEDRQQQLLVTGKYCTRDNDKQCKY